jgi:hypothetical protein
MSDSNNDIQEATAVVLSFAKTMNDWETRRYYRSRVEDGYEFTAAKDAELAGPLSVNELEAEYLVLFEKHCTARKRSYSGFPSSWSKGGKYVGISESAIIQVNQPKPGRIEVICKGGQFDRYYKFILFKRSNKWLIDNVSTCRRDNNWIRAIL